MNSSDKFCIDKLTWHLQNEQSISTCYSLSLSQSLISNKTMSYKKFYKRDYLLILIICFSYFLMMRNVISPFTHLILAVFVSFYFFPLKLFLPRILPNSSKRNRIIAELSYFVISNIISLTALSFFLDREGTTHNVIYIYGFINLAFLIYFFTTKNMKYNLILSGSTMLLIGLVIGL